MPCWRNFARTCLISLTRIKLWARRSIGSLSLLKCFPRAWTRSETSQPLSPSSHLVWMTRSSETLLLDLRHSKMLLEMLMGKCRGLEMALMLHLTKRQILTRLRLLMTLSRWNWTRWLANSRRISLIKTIPEKRSSSSRKIWKICMTYSWAREETKMRMTQCSPRNLSEELLVRAVPRMSSTCTARE